MESFINDFSEAKLVLEKFAANKNNFELLEKAGQIIVQALRKGNKIISCGNGGSMSDAMHFAEELTGRFRNNRPSLAAVAISDPTHITCVANDYGFDYIFSRFIEGVGNNNDVLLAISTSGNSENCLKAIEAAKQKKMKVIGLTGKSGGKMATMCDVEIRVPHSGYSDRIQEVHIKIIHSLINYVEQHINES
jgi:D-sedoheptulose 7-phosphate isomerase